MKLSLIRHLKKQNTYSHLAYRGYVVPLTLQFSNSFMSNIKEIYGLRSLMISEGLMTNDCR